MTEMLEERKIEDIIKQGETLAVEFKRDNPLSDRELVEAVVALANTEGGILLLGVEDDGVVSGLHWGFAGKQAAHFAQLSRGFCCLERKLS